MLDRQLWVGTQKNKQTNKAKREGGIERNARDSVYSHFYTNSQPQKDTGKKTKNKNDITKKYGKLKQGKLRGITKCLQVDTIFSKGYIDVGSYL